MTVFITKHALARYIERAWNEPRDLSIHPSLAEDEIISRVGPERAAAAREELTAAVHSQHPPLDHPEPIRLRWGNLQIIVKGGAVLTVKRKGQGNRAGTLDLTSSMRERV